MTDYMEAKTETPKSIFDLSVEKRWSIATRLWSNVEKTFGCWVWLGAKTRDGYGKLIVGQKSLFLAHRASYELTSGRIPNGKELDHLCRNRLCINPSHLEIVTKRENILRGISFSAINARKTTCLKGHLLEGDNLLPSMKLKGLRVCRTCFNERARCNYARRKALH